MTPRPLELLQRVAPDYGATLIVDPVGGLVGITVVRAGGAEYAFRLLVSVAGEHVSVREIADPGMLPGFCPDRHINGDRSFCLGWGEDNPSRIQDEAAARHWWATVYQLSLIHI